MLFVYSTIFVLDERAIAVRLVGTGLKHVGKVEIQYQGQWGTVCVLMLVMVIGIKTMLTSSAECLVTKQPMQQLWIY